MSLTTNGTPSSGRWCPPARRRRSQAAASSSARGLIVQTALTAGLRCAIRSRNARVTSVALRRLSAMPAARSAADARRMSSLMLARGRPRAGIHRDVAAGEPPATSGADDPVLVHAGVGDDRQLTRLAVFAVEIAAT